MTTQLEMPEVNVPVKPAASGEGKRLRKRRRSSSLFANGEPLIWLTGGSLVLCVLMIVILLLLIVGAGMSTFWPRPLMHATTHNGRVFMGEITRGESYVSQENEKQTRNLFRTGNYRLTQRHFHWVDDQAVAKWDAPRWALLIERLEWGRFYGFADAFVLVDLINEVDAQGQAKSPEALAAELNQRVEGFSPEQGGELRVLVEKWLNGRTQQVLVEVDAVEGAKVVGTAEVVTGPQAAWKLFNDYHPQARALWKQRRKLERVDTGLVNHQQEAARLAMREAELDMQDALNRHGDDSQPFKAAASRFAEQQQAFSDKQAWAVKRFDEIRVKIDQINDRNARYQMLMRTAGEDNQPAQTTLMRLDEVVRAYPANQLGFGGKLGIYISRWWEYLIDEPREANSEGGVFPAIFGTILMTILMAVAVVPFGVLASLYLREYAKAGLVVSIVRIAVNNLAGVPSIVFGVFGLGFFCYGVGGFMDSGPSFAMPRYSWFVLLGVIVGVATVAFLTMLMGITKPGRQVTTTKLILKYSSGVLWVLSVVAFFVLIAVTPFFDGFFRASLPNPTFGKGALIWASLTLALMTLPVVIVATEEALSAVPNSMREGSYACGASKWQTIRRIVLPRAMPGIMTGMILAMARGAGEVAPLMLVGAVKLAPELPFAWQPPFGMNRSFMHLGFHIYDVGFQSQNSEAAKPMVFTTTLLLIVIIASLNVAAIWLRKRLRRKFIASQF